VNGEYKKKKNKTCHTYIVNWPDLEADINWKTGHKNNEISVSRRMIVEVRRQVGAYSIIDFVGASS
jgi:hypothetical protein